MKIAKRELNKTKSIWNGCFLGCLSEKIIVKVMAFVTTDTLLAGEENNRGYKSILH
jgi:hypothetical protein